MPSASDSVAALHALLPRKANLIVNCVERPVAVSHLSAGDRIVVRPGERIGADGVVRLGTASADESLLTGEAIPVRKSPGDHVTGGAILLDGTLEVQVEVAGEEGMLNRMIAMVEQALANKTPVEERADRISNVFVPTIMALSALTAVVMWLLVTHTLVLL